MGAWSSCDGDCAEQERDTQKMAHQIDMTTGRPAMAYVGNKPWHKLGHEMQAGATIEEWIAAAGMGFEI